MNLNCPHCKNAFEIVKDHADTSDISCPKCNSKVSLLDLLSLNFDLGETQALGGETFVPKLGSSIAHFRLESHLGQGGFGSVFKAYDTRLERNVALKLPRMAAMSRWQAEVFIREAQAAAQLKDPNIVSVFEVGRDEEERVYIISELIDGATLAEWMKEHQPSQKDSARMIAKIAKSIHSAHENKVIHRDLKPRNVIIDSKHQPHITDFGLAKRENPEEITISSHGRILGTPAYMSPEQAMGKSEEADGRTDVYSLGVMLYELLTDQRPYRGETDILTEEILRGDAVEPSKLNPRIHPDVEAICMKAISRFPGERFATAKEFALDLERFADDQPTLTRPLTRLQRAGRLAKTHWIKFAVAAVLLASIAYGIVATVTRPTIPAVPPPLTRKVEFQVSPANATVSIVKVDYSKGYIDYETIHSPEWDGNGAGLRTDELTPGWYVIEAYYKEGDKYQIQEACRYVPESLDERTMGHFACSNWRPTGQENILWEPIEIVKLGNKSLKGEEMVLQEGGEFLVGASGLNHIGGKSPPVRAQEPVKMYDFYVAVNEVSSSNFEAVMGRLPVEMKTRLKNSSSSTPASVTNVPFFEALQYCEKIGARLPIFEEYLFAATNGGQTKYPHGDDWTREDWPLGDEAKQVEETNRIGVENLYSGQLEWTQDYAVPLDIKNHKPGFAIQPFRGMTNSRLMVGGPGFLFEGASEKLDRFGGPRAVNVTPIDRAQMFEVVGFRCYRSKTPRLSKDNPVIRYVTEANKNIRERSSAEH